MSLSVGSFSQSRTYFPSGWGGASSTSELKGAGEDRGNVKASGEQGDASQKPGRAESEQKKQGEKVEGAPVKKKSLFEMTPADQKKIQELKSGDTKVRQHEQAHIAAGGPYVKGGAQYQFLQGPDGQMYAIGGEVPIDSSPVPGNPEATIQKAKIVKQAALAPAEPSSQDRSVASSAERMEMNARMELAQKGSQAEAGSQTGAQTESKTGSKSGSQTGLRSYNLECRTLRSSTVDIFG